MFFVPANDGLNVKASLSVTAVVPSPVTGDVARVSWHWLFRKMPELPGVIGPELLVPASFIR